MSENEPRASGAAAPPAGTQPYCEKCGGPCFACTKPGALATVPAGPDVEYWKRLLVETALPLEVIVASEESDGPIREISPTLRASIQKAVANVRAALAGAASPSLRPANLPPLEPMFDEGGPDAER